jgi:hypothetical protein
MALKMALLEGAASRLDRSTKPHLAAAPLPTRAPAQQAPASPPPQSRARSARCIAAFLSGALYFVPDRFRWFFKESFRNNLARQTNRQAWLKTP